MNRLISNSKKAGFFAALIVLTLVVSASSTRILAQGGFHGAIYTSTNDGSSVNQNLYDNKADVYLNGGPQNANAAGLPDGTYYFQVTDPSGSVLLSTDPARCRQLSVSGGKVAGATGPCPHANGVLNSSNGSTPVQLIPFNDTPNNGGEYKVWLIRQNSNTTIVGDQMTSAVLNFRNNDAKTDNFKVKTNTPDPEPNVTYTLSGCKFYDADANGIRGGAEATVPSVRIIVSINGVEQPFVETQADGCWSFPGVPALAEYSVREILPLTGSEPANYWVQTAPAADSNGDRGYSGIANGPFDSETGVGIIDGLDFGNICFGPAAGGNTLGFWSNKNGEKKMQNGSVNTNVYPTAADNPSFAELGQGMNGNLNFLKRLNLKGEAIVRRAPVTVDHDPANYSAFRTWLLSGNAYNMSYMLSVQLAATSLNVRLMTIAGGDGQIVDASNVCDSTGYCLGIINIGNVRRLANESLGSAGGNITISGSPHRESQELMKNFLDAVNNNRLSFAQNSACTVFYQDVVEPPAP
jgi:hypothetical protein